MSSSEYSPSLKYIEAVDTLAFYLISDQPTCRFQLDLAGLPESISQHMSPVIAVGDPFFHPECQQADNYGLFNSRDEANAFVKTRPSEHNTYCLDGLEPAKDVLTTHSMIIEEQGDEAFGYTRLRDVVFKRERTQQDQPLKLVDEVVYSVWQSDYGLSLNRSVFQRIELTALGELILELATEIPMVEQLLAAGQTLTNDDLLEGSEAFDTPTIEDKSSSNVMLPTAEAMKVQEISELLLVLFMASPEPVPPSYY